MDQPLRARQSVGIISAGQYPDLIGSIELAHNYLSEKLVGTNLKPVGRPVIEAAGQRDMVLSWELAEVSAP